MSELKFSEVEQFIDEISKKDRFKNLVEKEVKNDIIIHDRLSITLDIIQQYYNIDNKDIAELENNMKWDIIEFVVKKLFEKEKEKR